MSGLAASLRFGSPPSRPQGVGGASPSGSGKAAAGSPGGGGKGSSKARPVDPSAWRAEYERVKERLVISLPAGGGGNGAPGDWRPELESARASLARLQGSAPKARSALEAMGGALGAQLEQLSAQEESLGGELGGLRAQRAELEAEVATACAAQEAQRQHMSELEGELAFLDKELEERRREVELRGDSVSDARPVARLRAAAARLREELAEMDVRTGVLQHLLLSGARTD